MMCTCVFLRKKYYMCIQTFFLFNVEFECSKIVKLEWASAYISTVGNTLAHHEYITRCKWDKKLSHLLYFSFVVNESTDINDNTCNDLFICSIDENF